MGQPCRGACRGPARHPRELLQDRYVGFCIPLTLSQTIPFYKQSVASTWVVGVTTRTTPATHHRIFSIPSRRHVGRELSAEAECATRELAQSCPKTASRRVDTDRAEAARAQSKRPVGRREESSWTLAAYGGDRGIRPRGDKEDHWRLTRRSPLENDGGESPLILGPLWPKRTTSPTERTDPTLPMTEKAMSTVSSQRHRPPRSTTSPRSIRSHRQDRPRNMTSSMRADGGTLRSFRRWPCRPGDS